MTTRVAIIGYSFRFPGTDASRFWQDLIDGRDLISQVGAERWAHDVYRHPDKSHPGTSYTFAAGSIGDVAGFDAGFFGISPREAALMDPQQRLLLEMSWECLENSGTRPSTLRGSRCGVYVGIASADYSYRMADDLAVADSTMATGNTASIAANRISYVLDLRGPSMAIDTACSSALVAFHQACRAIASGEVDQALAGSVNLHLHPYGFLVFSKASMLSPRGRCRVFDASADGYVRSEGGGVFFLKDYARAQADGDPILALVAATAVNTDGRKTGLTVPSHEAQATLLKETCALAGIDPASIDYLEAHGTGTAVGDPIETRAIGQALGTQRPRNRPLPIGSVKSNLGHLETSSGAAGLVKALLCLAHRQVPPTIGVEVINPEIRCGEWNLELVTQPLSLRKSGKLTIGVNSFGFGGANAHVLVESPPPATVSADATTIETLPPLIVSARCEPALKAAASDLAEVIAQQSPADYYRTAYNAAFRRDWHERRAIVFGDTPQEIAARLASIAAGEPRPPGVETVTALASERGLAFVYTGNGSQWVGMGRHLLDEEPVFRSTLVEVDALFHRAAGFSLLDEFTAVGDDDRYASTAIAQPALFALQVGITRLLAARGIRPAVVVGHSVGEVAAAWAAGALSLSDAVQVIYQRSRLQETTRGCGQMTALALGPQAAEALLAELGVGERVVVAGINSPGAVTIAGEGDSLAVVEAELVVRHVRHKRLDLDYAFHSSTMDGIAADIRGVLTTLQPRSTKVPFCSTVSGTLMPGERLDAEYWWHNVRRPVLFASAINAIADREVKVFAEIGPHPILRGYVHECLKARGVEGRVVVTGTRGDDGAERLLAASSQLLLSGVEVDWRVWFPRPAGFAALPNYPWQRERHWHPVTSAAQGLISRRKEHPLLGYRLPQHLQTWENDIDPQLNPTLADHVVGGAIVFPGAGFAELALAAAVACGGADGGATIEIEDLEIRSPLLLSRERSATVRTAVDPHDGRLTISSRELLSQDPWVSHVVARIVPEPQDTLLRGARCQPPPLRPPDFTHRDHAVLTQAVGIAYGPAFQCLAHGWIDGDSALAVFRIPDVVDAELPGFHLHPALFDNALQLVFELLRQAIEQHEGIAFVPTRFGRMAFRCGARRPDRAQLTLRKRGSRSLHAEFALFSDDGSVVAVVEDVRLRAIRLSRGRADHLRFLVCQATPRPWSMATTPPPAIGFAAVKAAMVDVVQRATLKGTHRRYSEEVDPLLDSLCSRYTQLALRDIAADGEHLSLGQVTAMQSSHPECAPFLADLLARAQDDGALVASADGWLLLPDQQEQSSAVNIWNSLVSESPDYFPIIHSVGRVGLHLTRLLAGRSTLAAVCPEESSLARLQRQALGSRARQKLGQALRDLILRGLAQLPRGQRLGVLEIGGGAPLFALDIGFALDFNRGDYTFAGTSTQAFGEELRRLQEFFPAIRSHIIGPEAEPAGDLDPAPGSCALVFVTLDFAALEQTHGALALARRCLAPGGTLAVVGWHPSRWVDFVFGAKRDAWLLGDGGRWLSSQRPSRYWQAELDRHGFESSKLLEFSPDTLSGPYLLLGRGSDDLSRRSAVDQPCSRRWLLLADREGYSAQISDRLTALLQTSGDLVIQATQASSDRLQALLGEACTHYGGLDGLVLLAGLVGEAVERPLEASLDDQVARCAAAAAIIQACEASALQTTCWLITRGVGTGVLSSMPALAVEGYASDAALWGFGRSLQNEATGSTIRLLDLAPALSADLAAELLYREFSAADGEDEVFLEADGVRHASRLRLEQRPDSRERETIASPTVCLGFQFPGQLRNLRWEVQPRRPLAVDEVEVEVQATGLNFRDVMYALGLLPDEAIENGFAGPTLGFEFAGIVRNTGASDSRFNPGDKVVGFGPSTFANRVVTQRGAIAHLPPELSFEAAATIPSTFFTVYYSLHHLARLEAGEKVLIHGAAGGVGIAAVQVARHLGAEIFATAGSEEKRDFLRLLGVDHVFDSRSLAFADEILEQTGGQGVDVVLNSLAGEAINRNLRVLRPFGRFLELGKRDFYDNTRLGLRPFRNNISYFGIDADQLMLLQPELAQRLFNELITLFHEGKLHPLPYRDFAAERVVDAFRHMQQARQIGKVVVTYEQGIHHLHWPPRGPRRRLQLAADASYLVSGGLRGFGLRSAEWLAEKGARHLILIGRRGADSEEAQAALARLAEQGVQVHVAACDVTCRDDLVAVFAETSRSMPPLRGILHAAAVIDDRLVRNTSAEQIQRVLAPKVRGAILLHELTKQQPLDLFVVFSSATAAFGNPGQASYVAANVALEALATYRRACNLPAIAIGWGPIADAGFLARNKKTKDALESRMGGSALEARVALDALEDLVLANRSGVAVLDFDWKAISRFLPGAGSPKFSELAWHADDLGNDDDHSSDVQRLLLELPDDALEVAIADLLKTEIGDILRIAPERIDTQRSLYDLGLDSLMGVELAVALEGRFGIRLPVMALSQGPTISKLAGRIVQQLRHGEAGGERGPADADLAAQAAEVARQQGVVIPPEAIAAFAADLQAQEDLPAKEVPDVA